MNTYEQELVGELERFDAVEQWDEIAELELPIEDIEDYLWAYFTFNIDYKKLQEFSKESKLTVQQITNCLQLTSY